MSTEQMMTAAVMETAKPPIGAYTLPAGYLDLATNELWQDVEVRELRGREEDMLSSRQVPGEKKLSGLLAGCLLRIGPVTDKGRIAKIVDELTVGDRVYLLFAIRRVTLGNDLPVREECPNRDCKAKNLFVIDLSELTIKAMPDPRKRIYDVTLPSGRTARFRASVGADEIRVAKLAKNTKIDDASQMLLMRLEMVDGEPPTISMLQDMGMRDRAYLREQFEEIEGGIDTSIQLECPSCGHEWEKDLNLASADFFSLSGTRKR